MSFRPLSTITCIIVRANITCAQTSAMQHEAKELFILPAYPERGSKIQSVSSVRVFLRYVLQTSFFFFFFSFLPLVLLDIQPKLHVSRGGCNCYYRSFVPNSFSESCAFRSLSRKSCLSHQACNLFIREMKYPRGEIRGTAYALPLASLHVYYARVTPDPILVV